VELSKQLKQIIQMKQQGQESHLAGDKPVGYLQASSTIRGKSRGVCLVLEM